MGRPCSAERCRAVCAMYRGQHSALCCSPVPHMIPTCHLPVLSAAVCETLALLHTVCLRGCAGLWQRQEEVQAALTRQDTPRGAACAACDSHVSIRLAEQTKHGRLSCTSSRISLRGGSLYTVPAYAPGATIISCSLPYSMQTLGSWLSLCCAVLFCDVLCCAVLQAPQGTCARPTPPREARAARAPARWLL